MRAPTESKWGLCDKYLPELYNEIGCKDLPAEVLCAYKAGYYYKAALQALKEEGGIEIPCGFEVPHPWHYNVSDAFPILNLVNDLNVTVNLNKMGQWIQNYEEVSRIWDYHIRQPRMLVTYYDIPKRVWDQQFPINRQMNYTKHDYQMREHNIKVDSHHSGLEGTHKFVHSTVHKLCMEQRVYSITTPTLPHSRLTAALTTLMVLPGI